MAELSLYFNYNSNQLQWLLLAPGLINWVTGGTQLGMYHNYVEMDIDDTFTPDDAWDPTTHEIDYSDGDSLRMNPEDVITSAEWSRANNFRLDQLFNFGSTVADENGTLAYNGSESAIGADPLLAAFQAPDPATGHPYSDDFGWISHTYDTPYLDVGCATQDYIEAELSENSSSIAAAPGATAGTGGLGITESTDDTLTYGAEDPQVFVPGNHSGFANLVPGNPATVDEPDLDDETAATGGDLAAGTYQYAVTDQFTAAPVSAAAGESAAFLTGPITVPASGSVSMTWQAICHAANYNIYRELCTDTTCTAGNGWTLIGNYYTPAEATLPDDSSTDASPASTASVTGAGQQELTFTDTGASAAECDGSAPGAGAYCVTPGAASWTAPPITENAVESAWEQNPYFIPAMQALGITAVGADASKPYPNPPTDQFGIGAAYTGPSTPPARPLSTARPRWSRATRSISSTTLRPRRRNWTSTTPCTRPPSGLLLLRPWLTAWWPRCSSSCSPITPSRATSIRPTSWGSRLVARSQHGPATARSRLPPALRRPRSTPPATGCSTRCSIHYCPNTTAISARSRHTCS